MCGQRQQCCTHCTAGPGDERERLRQLQLLALLEYPGALPADLALRLARELLADTDQRSAFRCETVP